MVAGLCVTSNVLICSHTKSLPQVCTILILPEIEFVTGSIVPLNSTVIFDVLPSRQLARSKVSVWSKVLPVRVASVGPDTVVSVTVNVKDSFTVVVVNPEQLVWACAGNITALINGFDHCSGKEVSAAVVTAMPLRIFLR